MSRLPLTGDFAPCQFAANGGNMMSWLRSGKIAFALAANLTAASALALPAVYVVPQTVAGTGAAGETIFVASEDEISTRVQALVAQTLALPAEDVRINSSFRDDLNADELDIVELAILMEEEFEIEMPDEVIESIATVGDLVAAIVKLSN